MAKEQQGTANELDEMAFSIFKERAAKAPNAQVGEQAAIVAYRQAESFLTIREKIRSGELETTEPTGPQLADVCAPNLKKTHPHNLVSKKLGNLQTVNRVKKWLDEHPTAEAYEEFEWDKPTTDLARVIFPAYCN